MYFDDLFYYLSIGTITFISWIIICLGSLIIKNLYIRLTGAKIYKNYVALAIDGPFNAIALLIVENKLKRVDDRYGMRHIIKRVSAINVVAIVLGIIIQLGIATLLKAIFLNSLDSGTAFGSSSWLHNNGYVAIRNYELVEFGSLPQATIYHGIGDSIGSFTIAQLQTYGDLILHISLTKEVVSYVVTLANRGLLASSGPNAKMLFMLDRSFIQDFESCSQQLTAALPLVEHYITPHNWSSAVVVDNSPDNLINYPCTTCVAKPILDLVNCAASNSYSTQILTFPWIIGVLLSLGILILGVVFLLAIVTRTQTSIAIGKLLEFFPLAQRLLILNMGDINGVCDLQPSKFSPDSILKIEQSGQKDHMSYRFIEKPDEIIDDDIISDKRQLRGFDISK